IDASCVEQAERRGRSAIAEAEADVPRGRSAGGKVGRAIAAVEIGLNIGRCDRVANAHIIIVGGERQTWSEARCDDNAEREGPALLGLQTGVSALPIRQRRLGSRAMSISAMGLPTMFDAPTTTTLRPSTR